MNISGSIFALLLLLHRFQGQHGDSRHRHIGDRDGGVERKGTLRAR